jgi:hypothetical protein
LPESVYKEEEAIARQPHEQEYAEGFDITAAFNAKTRGNGETGGGY